MRKCKRSFITMGKLNKASLTDLNIIETKGNILHT